MAAALAAGVFWAAAAHTYRLGFPLDDAWIFQTYARNLAAGLGWVYVPGQVSAGATAPLWVLLLTPGAALGLPPLLWAWLWGVAALAGLATLSAAFWRRWAPPAFRSWAWAVGLLLAWEWHLVWAAASGMETLLFTLGATALLVGMTLEEPCPAPGAASLPRGGEAPPSGRRWAALGLGLGLLVWLRPEGLALGLPLGWAIVVRYAPRWRQIGRAGAAALLAAALPLALYLAFNATVGGHLWPNTFYAKQAEYAALQARPLGERWARVAAPLLAGPGSLLVPGLLWGAVVAWRRRRWIWFAAPLWAAGHLTAYALRLPVAYQHGRYALPVLPVWLLWGAWGLAAAAEARPTSLWRRAAVTWALSVAALTLAFLAVGAQTYARDVAVIESQMVETARWVAHHTPPDTLVAAHDIGALGYFAQRPLVDLAGLVSPEVIPYLGTERPLAAWVRAQGAAYLVAFVGEYPALEAHCPVVFRAPERFVAQYGHPPMQVCRLR